MAVPKRKMSRSNTRAPPFAVEDRAPTLVACATAPAASRSCRTPRARTAAQYNGAGPRRSDRGDRLHVVRRRRSGTRPPPARCWSAARVSNSTPELLERALTHRSYAYENGGLPHQRAAGVPRRRGARPGRHRHAVPHATPTCPRASWPSCAPRWSTCARWPTSARDGSAWAPTCRLGRGEEATGGRDKASILADTLEARDRRGLPRPAAWTRPAELVHRLFDPLHRRSRADLGAGLDWKTSLQELTAAAAASACPSTWSTTSRPRPREDLHRRGRAWPVSSFGTGTGRSKKEAEQQAAEAAWRRDRRARRAADERPTRPPAVRRDRCLSCPRSRSSGAGSSRSWSPAAPSPRSRSRHPRAVAATSAGAGRLRGPRWPAARVAAARRRGKYLWLPLAARGARSAPPARRWSATSA